MGMYLIGEALRVYELCTDEDVRYHVLNGDTRLVFCSVSFLTFSEKIGCKTW